MECERERERRDANDGNRGRRELIGLGGTKRAGSQIIWEGGRRMELESDDSMRFFLKIGQNCGSKIDFVLFCNIGRAVLR